jgi:Lrp/AsnC family transcriptional regulator, leucine-responsive regulatory protein
MKLSLLERQFLLLTHFDPTRSVKDIASSLATKPHRVRYIKAQLSEKGIITVRPFIDTFKLGLLEYKIYLSLGADSLLKLHEVVQWLNQRAGVSWIGEPSSHYDVVFDLLTTDPLEVRRILSMISKEIGVAIENRLICQVLALTFLEKTYLATSSQPRKVVFRRIQEATPLALSPELAQLLEALVRERAYSESTLSKNLGVPRSTLQGRMKALEDLGVIKGLIQHIRAVRFGLQVRRLLVSCRHLDDASRRLFYEHFIAIPELVVVVECLGEWDFEVTIEVHDGRVLQKIASNLKKTFAEQIKEILEIEFLAQHQPRFALNCLTKE